MNWSDAAGAVTSGALTLGINAYNNEMAAARTAEDRRLNFYYGEKSAAAADRRTRALYNDFYSPEALLRQYQNAGLSPSLMFGGTPGQGGLSGAKGTGAMGLQTPYMPMSLVEAAQAQALFAQAEKTEAETNNINQDTIIKELQTTWQQMQNNEKSIEFKLITTYLFNPEDPSEKQSLFEVAKTCDTYEKFVDKIKNLDGLDDFTRNAIYTEKGQETLRNLYKSTKQFDTDIAVLASEKTDAQFVKKVLDVLNDNDYANKNANAVIKQFEAAAASSELTAEQKNAVNRLIQGMKDGTGKDLMIVLGMIVSNFLGNTGANANISIPIGRNKKE